jgi:hypothetical protein
MKRLAKSNRKELETRTYEIASMHPHMLDEFERMFRTAEYLCNIGASREISMFIDGDGRTDFNFKRVDKKEDLKEPNNLEESLQQDTIKFDFD